MEDDGFSLIEATLSIAIISVIVSSLASILAITSKNYLDVSIAAKEVLVHQTINELAHEIIRNYDSSPFLLYPKVHSNGEILFTDGSYNPVIYASERRKPDKHSDAITSSQLEIGATIRVYRADLVGKHIRFEGCQRFTEIFNKDLFQTYIGIAPDGLYELSPHLYEYIGIQGNSRHCHALTLAIDKSMLTKTASFNSAMLVKQIVPVSDLYTIYLDRTKSLRYLSHKGRINIENQPIIEDAPSILINLTESLDKKLLGVNIKSKDNLYGRFPEISSISSLAHTSHLSFLLNRP